MTINPVPFAVKGGLHSERVLRRFAGIATKQAEGIALPGDLKVSPLNTSGPGVQIADGGMIIRNRAVASGAESYIGSNEGPATVAVAPTGSSPRSDLIIIRVEDPAEDGSVQAPADAEAGPYLFARVISGVPAGTKRVQDIPQYAGLSAITLARIDQPAGSGAVTAAGAMITDLRKVALPRRETRLVVITPATNVKIPNSTADQNWPITANGGVVEQIDVPEWATRVAVLTSYTAIGARGNTYGSLKTKLGTLTAAGAFDTTITPTTDPFTIVAQAAADLAVPAAMRGKTQNLSLHAAMATTGQADANRPWTTSATRVVVQLEFKEQAD